jgi:hypothetical protein
MKHAVALLIALALMTAQIAEASWVMRAEDDDQGAKACPAYFELASIDYEDEEILICVPKKNFSASDESSSPSGDDDTDYAWTRSSTSIIWSKNSIPAS